MSGTGLVRQLSLSIILAIAKIVMARLTNVRAISANSGNSGGQNDTPTNHDLAGNNNPAKQQE